MKDIVGTTTEQNLKDAFISESTSILKYLIFADKSEYEYVEELFKHFFYIFIFRLICEY